MAEVQSSFSCLSLETSFGRMLEKVAHKLNMDTLRVIKTKLKTKHSFICAERIDNAIGVLKCLVGSRLINEHDLDLLEDLLDPNEETLRIVSDFKTKRPVKIDFLPSESVTVCCAGMGRSLVSFYSNESLSEFNQPKVFSFKKALCENLHIKRYQISYVGKVKDRDESLVFQMPQESVAQLRHCIGWRKAWLLSLQVCGVKVNDEEILPVKEIKVAELRLQEDPVLVSPVLRVIEAARTGDITELKQVLQEFAPQKRLHLLNIRTDGMTPLIVACKHGNVAIAEALIEEYGVDIEQEGSVKIEGDLIECCTPLWIASLGGHMDLVRYLVERAAEVNHTTLTSSMPLRAASFNGHTEVVRFLLNHGAEVNKRNQDGNTCVMVACWNGHLGTFNLLRTSGAQLDVKDKQGFSMIHCATAANNLTLLHELLSSGSDVNAATVDGITPLMLACEKNHPDVTRLLLQQGADVNRKSEKGLTAVHFCALSCSLASLRHLIESDADLSTPTERGSTSLMLACAKGFVKIVTALLGHMVKDSFRREISSGVQGVESYLHNTETGSLNKAAGVNATNESNETSLIVACEKGNSEIVRLLLRFGADPNLADKNGITPLMIAARKGSEEIVKQLLASRADINSQDKDSNTPLHTCLMNFKEFTGHKNCLDLMLRNGADLQVKNKEGNTPMEVAVKGKLWNGQAVEMLHKQGAELITDLKDDNQDTAFHKCCRSGDCLSITYLLECDAKPAVERNKEGDTALRVAALEGNEQITKLLIDSCCDFTPQEKVEALELLGVGLLSKEIAREWDVNTVLDFWHQAMKLRADHDIIHSLTPSQSFPLEYFLAARNSKELKDFGYNPSVLTAQALHVCLKWLPRTHSRLPALMGTIGERYAQIGEFLRSLNIWMFVLDVQMENLGSSLDRTEDVLNTLRCFADAFGFVLSRNVQALNFSTVAEILRKALNGLVSCKAVFEVRDVVIKYALHYLSAMFQVASTEAELLSASELVQAFVRRNFRTCSGATLLHLACSSVTEGISSLKEHLHFPNLQVCQALLEHGCDVNALDKERNTPLHTVMIKGHAETDILVCLIENGAHMDARNSAGSSAVDLARCTKVRQLIRSKSAVASLQCLAARAILERSVAYKGLLPKTLEEFVQMH